MSVVTVKIFSNYFTMSCDSIMIHNETSQTKDQTFKFSKILKTKEMILGCVGDVAEITALSLFLKEYKLSDLRLGDEALQQMMWSFKKWYGEKSGIDDIDNTIIIGTRFGVWVYTGLSGLEIKNSYAIGAGESFAMGALAMGASSEKACKIACQLSTQCEEPIKTEKMKFNK